MADCVVTETPDITKSFYNRRVLQTLNEIRRENILTDIVLEVEGQTFSAHRCVLAASSRFFYGLFTTDMKERATPHVTLKGIAASVMEEVLSYLYTGEIEVDVSNAEDLITSANYLLLPPLKNIACKYIERNMTASSSIYNYLFAEKYECPKLRNYARELIKQNFATVAKSNDFRRLSYEHIKELISSDDIVIQAEEDVFEVIMDWIAEDQGNRDKFFSELFRHIRLSSISQEFVYKTITRNPVVRSNTECMDMILDEMCWRGLYAGQELPPQQPRTSLQTHADAIITCGGLAPDGQIRNLSLCYVPAEQAWYQLASMHSRRCRHGLAACKGFVYAIGGKGEDSFHSSVERYDPRTNTWSNVKPLAKRVKLMGTATLDGHLYIAGGIEFTEELGRRRCDTVQRYDPSTNTWASVASLSSRRSSICLVTDHHFLYSIGGLGDDDFLPNLERYDSKLNAWSTLAPLREKRGCATGLCLKEKIYVFGGTVDAFSRHASLSSEVYDINSNEWQSIAPMQVPRFHASAVLVRDLVYVFGGIGSESVGRHNLRTVECYDVNNNRWLAPHAMPYEETYSRGCSISIFKGLIHSLRKVC